MTVKLSTLTLNDMVVELSLNEIHANELIQLAACCPHETRTRDAVTAMAIWILQKLYDPRSEQEANLKRIVTGLTMAAEQMQGLSQRMQTYHRRLASEHAPMPDNFKVQLIQA